MDKNTCTETREYKVTAIFQGTGEHSEVWSAVSPLHAAFLFGGSFIDEIRKEADELYDITGDLSVIDTAVHNLVEHTVITVEEYTGDNEPVEVEFPDSVQGWRCGNPECLCQS